MTVGSFVARSTAVLILVSSTLRAQPPQGTPARKWLVGFRAGTPESQADAAIQNVQARTLKKISQIGVQLVEFPATANEAAVVNVLKNRPEVAFIEPDALVPVSDLTPNDPWYANWEWHLPKISAPAAWSQTTGNSNVVIAIIDTGVESTHEDLAGKIVPGWNIFGNNSDTRDVYGHGTLVAGTAAAASNNGLGVASVCWQCSIMPIRVSDTNGYASYSDLASGVTWAADHGARVANMSYEVSTSSTVTSAAQYFMSKGGVVTASAGNSGVYVSASDNPYILTVGATDYYDALYSWSNYGNIIDLVAPGCVYTTARGNVYSSACGTSVSAPLVAGVAALLFSANPALTPNSVISYLKQSTYDLGVAGWDSIFGYGRLDANNALTLAGGGSTSDTTAPSVSIDSPATGTTVSGSVSTQASASDNVGVTSVSIAVDGTTLCTVATSPYDCPWNTGNYSNGGHTVTATARDAAGNTKTATSTVTVSNASDTTPPTIAITSPSNGATVSKNVTIATASSDNVGVVSVDLYVDNVLVATDTGAPFSFKWNTQRVSRGSHTLLVKAHDAAGNTGSSALVTVYR